MPTRRIMAALLVIGVLAQVTPVRAAPSGGALPPQLVALLRIPTGDIVPADAVGVALNVTVTEPIAPGYLTVFPCGEQPLASNLNYVAGQTVPNFVISGVDADGFLCISTLSTTDVIVDVAGYIPAGSPMVGLDAPQRFLDTREGFGAPKARVPASTVVEVPLAGGFGVPADAETVVFNATSVQAAAAGFLTVFPCGQPIPATSTLNVTAGAIVPNLVVSDVGADGKVCFFSNVETDLVADVSAYVPAGADGLTTLPQPQRIIDTRSGLGGPMQPVGTSNRVVQVAGDSGVPLGATAAIVNLTATNGAAAGFATAFPCDGAVPLVSNLNFTPGANVANLAIVKLAADGTLCLRANQPADLIVDVLGYTSGASTFVPIAPERFFDSREGVDPTCRVAVGWKMTGQLSGYFTLHSADNDTTIVLPNQPEWNGPGRSLIGPSCRISVDGILSGRRWVYEYTSTGQFIRQYEPRSFGGLFFGSATDDGLVVMQGNSIVDVETGATIVTLPTNSGNTQWHWVGATADGSIMVTSRVSTAANDEVWYWGEDGSSLGTITLPPLTFATDISASGSYLLTNTGGFGAYGPGLVVMDLTGEPVVTLPGGLDGSFMTDGSIAACVDPPGSATPQVVRWDLFTPPQPYGRASWPANCGQQAVR